MFEILQPQALCLVATDGPISIDAPQRDGSVRRFGHNRGVWPAKVAKTGQWKDAVTVTHDQSPFHWMGTQFRLWAPSAEERDRLAASVVDLIAARAERDGSAELRRGFQDLGETLDLGLFELEVTGIAQRLGVPVWDDTALEALLDDVALTARRRSHSGDLAPRHVEQVFWQRLGRA